MSLTKFSRPEVAMALRQRLNETVEELDALRREHAELDVKVDGQCRKLVVAKADRAPHMSSALCLTLTRSSRQLTIGRAHV